MAKTVQFVKAISIPASNNPPTIIPDLRVMENKNNKPKQKLKLNNDISRLEIRLNMIQSNQDTGLAHQLQRQLQEMVNKLLEADPTIKILPWFDNAEQTPLPNNKVPAETRIINRYFQRIKPKNTGFNYGEVKIQHRKKWEDIIFEMNQWLTQTRHGVYYQKVQCQSTVNIGWLLWSFRRIDTDALENEIRQIFGYTIQLRFQNITNGTPIHNEDNIVRALHVIANQTEADKVSTIFQQTYNFKATKFPLGIILRFVPHFNRVGKSKQPNLHKWRYKQRVFSQAVENPERPMSSTNWEILSLDKEIKNFGSLRKAIMRIPTRYNENESLFLSADTSFFRSNEVIFTFLPKHESEARLFVTNLVSYFHHKLDKTISKQLFHQEALARAEQSIWDPDNNEIITSVDLYIDQSGDICDNFDLLDNMGTIQSNDQVTNISYQDQEINKVQRLFSGDDNTSIGTFFTNNEQYQTPTTNGPLTVTTSDITQTHTSSITNVNTETENRMNIFSEELQSIKQLLNLMIAQNTKGTSNITTDNGNDLMLVEYEKNIATKRKAGDSEESTCEET